MVRCFKAEWDKFDKYWSVSRIIWKIEFRREIISTLSLTGDITAAVWYLLYVGGFGSVGWLAGPCMG